MPKQTISRFSVALVLITIIVVGFRASVGHSAIAEALPASAPQNAASAGVIRRPAEARASADVQGAVLTQVFDLRPGWTSIYLEVAPINDSPLVNVGTDDEPIMAPELSTIEAVFAAVSEGGGLSCGDCLESVWSWNIPLSSMDYIVDPAEGLWDAPGWQRYFPEGSLGPDGESRAFLSDLYSLHANTAYLIKLKDGTGPATLTVRGTPVIAHHQWLPDSYNLAGFPIDPDASSPPTVATFFQDLFAGPSPVTEIRALQADGTWGDPLAPQAELAYGEAYLVYYRNGAMLNYTAPFDIISTIGESLDFTPGFGGSRQTVRVENLANVTTDVEMRVLAQTTPGVTLRYDSDPESDTDPLLSLWPNPAAHSLAAGGAVDLNLIVPAADQPADGEALLEIRSPDLGTRWLLPVTALQGDFGGLWIGDVVVNDVSEGRLGGTNVQSGELTIALRPRDLSGLQGAALLVEDLTTTSVALTATLALPLPEDIQPLPVISATAPYVAGYVFVDSNQNGQRDADERGLAGITVKLKNSTQMTDEHGLYVFADLAQDIYAISLDAVPAGYTTDFPVTLPQTTTVTSNALPALVQMGADGIDFLEPAGYRRQTLAPPYTLPQYDDNDNRVEPLLNFGVVPIYDVSLWTGHCGELLDEQLVLAPMLNGVLVTSIPDAALNPRDGVSHLLLGPSSYVLTIEKHNAGGVAGQGIACGEIIVGAPTRFANGDGSEFRFRLILRVNEQGAVELLPDYVTALDKRISSVNFSLVDPVVATGADFGDINGLIDFSILITPDDPLNPYKHKYHPDHDNLDVKFNPINFNTVAPYLWESYEVRRRMQLELTELPPVEGADATIAANLDWGGGVWGGLYKEVIAGIHKNDITVRGYFVIRHVLAWEDLIPQSYDQSGGGGG